MSEEKKMEAKNEVKEAPPKVKKAQPSAKERGLRSVNVYLEGPIVERFHEMARKAEDLTATAMTRKLMLDWLASVE